MKSSQAKRLEALQTLKNEEMLKKVYVKSQRNSQCIEFLLKMLSQS